MAVFIKRERLGSISPSREARLTQKIESMPAFQVMQSQLSQANQQAQKKAKGKWDDNAEVQKWRTLTPEEKARDAIDRMIPTTKQITELRTGKECSFEDARKVAENLAYKSDAQKEEQKK
jgi:hypothetical protein